MVVEQKILSVFMTKQFREIWKDFLKLVDKSPRFKSMIAMQLNSDGSKNRNLKKGKDSARVRFAVLVCIEELLKEKEKLIAKNEYDEVEEIIDE